jgi:two-component system, OmpR family, KDP operon response regulator KdpE
MKVLVVDDEPQILRALQINIRARGDEVVTAATGADALVAAARHRPDVAIVDLGLPDIPGLDVIVGIRGWSNMPILVLSGRTDTTSKVAALDAGADDFIDKPFAIEELFARLRAVLRRNPAGDANPQPSVQVGAWTVDFASRTVTDHAGAQQRLTPTEWSIVTQLAAHADQLVTQNQLLEAIWGPQYVDESGYLRFHLRQLRRKLEPEPAHPRYLLTEPGVGYRLQLRPGGPAR